RRVEVGPGDATGDVDGEGDGEAPAPADQEPVAAGLEDLRAAAGLVERGDGHRHHAVAEADDDAGAETLGGQLSGRRLPPPRTGNRCCSHAYVLAREPGRRIPVRKRADARCHPSDGGRCDSGASRYCGGMTSDFQPDPRSTLPGPSRRITVE